VLTDVKRLSSVGLVQHVFAVIRCGALHVTADETQLFIMLLLRVTTIKLFFVLLDLFVYGLINQDT